MTSTHPQRGILLGNTIFLFYYLADYIIPKIISPITIILKNLNIMSSIEHAITHVGHHVIKNHGKEIAAGIVGTAGTAAGAGLSSVGLSSAGAAVSSAASGALATAGTAATTFATTIVAPAVAAVTPVVVAGAAIYGVYKFGKWLFSD